MTRLRPITEADSAMVLEWRNKAFVRMWMYTDQVISEEEHNTWFARMLKDLSKIYLIYEINDDPAGVVAFTEINKRDNTASWAFYLGFENLPKGSGTRMEELALAYAFNTMALRKLKCEVLATNLKVLKMHYKHGFKKEGVFAEEIIKAGEPVDVVRLALFDNDYEKNIEATI